MITEYFNPILWPFIKVWLVGFIIAIIFISLYKTVKNLINGHKDKIWSDIKYTVKFVGGVSILALGLFWFMMSIYVIGNMG